MNIPSNLFIFIDILVAAIFLFCIIKGVLNGFLYELINLLFLAVSFGIGWFLSPIFADKAPLFKFSLNNDALDKIANSNKTSYLINNIIWLVIIVLILNLLFLFIKPLFKKLSKIPLIGTVNRVLGGFLGSFRALIICLLISVLISMPIIKNGKTVINSTVLKYGDDVTKFATKLIIDNVDLESLKNDIDDFDVDTYRQELTEWLINNGVLDE